jgi:2',5'-phosphodiesterase
MASRHDVIIAEIQDMAPDVVCFQEVDHAHYKHRLLPSMRQLGYEGILLQRQDDQGLATFWKCLTFELEHQKHAILHHLAETYLQMCDLCPSELSVVRQSIDRPEAVLLVRLRHIDTNIQLALANIHVTWSQLKYPALQALQASLGMHELEEFAHGIPCAKIICGDFNSPPDSLPYQLMSRGQLDDVMVTCLKQNCTFQDRVEVLRAVDLFNVLPRSAFTINSPLLSAYNTLIGKEPAVTNCDDSGGIDNVTVHQLCLDYIWFDQQSLDVAAVLQTPPSEIITRHYALPSVVFPSDHIALSADFRLLQSDLPECNLRPDLIHSFTR